MRRPIKKRPVTNPDVKFGDESVEKLINCIMLRGQKETARKVVYAAFEEIKNGCFRGESDFYLPVKVDGRETARLYPLTRRHLEDSLENTRIIQLLAHV